MEMSKEEIVRRYSQEHTMAQVKVLAELNAVPEEKIKEILIDAGIPEKELNKKKRGCKKAEEKKESAPAHIPQTIKEVLAKALIDKQEQIDKLQAEMVDINMYLQACKE